jgi:hypothetical protein
MLDPSPLAGPHGLIAIIAVRNFCIDLFMVSMV